MARLTDRFAKAGKKPNKEQVLIRDADVRGVAFRITLNGCKTWVWDGRIRRQMRRITIWSLLRPECSRGPCGGSSNSSLDRHRPRFGNDKAARARGADTRKTSRSLPEAVRQTTQAKLEAGWRVRGQVQFCLYWLVV